MQMTILRKNRVSTFYPHDALCYCFHSISILECTLGGHQDESRAKEALETYSAAGFEVHLANLAPADFEERCKGCAATVCRDYTVVYTRKKPGETQ